MKRKFVFKYILLSWIVCNYVLNPLCFAAIDGKEDVTASVSETTSSPIENENEFFFAGLPVAQIKLQGDDPTDLPSQLAPLVDRMVKNQNDAPEWVVKLANTSLHEYFSGHYENRLSNKSKSSLIYDALRLHTFHSQDPAMHKIKNFDRSLRSFVKGLGMESLFKPSKDSGWNAMGNYGDWTVEMLVVALEVKLMEKPPGFFKSFTEYFSKPRIRGLTAKGAIILIVGSLAFYAKISPEFRGIIVGAFMAGMTGPLGRIFNSVLGFFFAPTVDRLEVVNNRYFGPLGMKINSFYDWFLTSDVNGTNQIGVPKVAVKDLDGMDFGGMTPENQMTNWKKCLRMWINVTQNFGQLLPPQYHGGRSLSMLYWNDETTAANLITTYEVQLQGLDIEAKNYLSNVIIPFNTHGAVAEVDEVYRLYGEFTSSMRKALLDVSLTTQEQIDWVRKAQRDLKDLENVNLVVNGNKVRLRPVEIRNLVEIERKKSFAIGALATAVALNEMRSFMVAEGNRQSSGAARLSQEVVRNGLNLQALVDQYQPLVAHQMVQMGYEHSLAPKAQRKVIVCNKQMATLTEILEQ